ncbi:MAG: glycosyltransferase [Nitrospirae bacterium]|nr:glycosyltransferase [Nitrospirota bacterium]
MTAARPLRVCYFGTYSVGEGYPVNRVLIEGLRRAGVSVWECRAGLWDDPADPGSSKWQAPRGALGRLGLAVRWAGAWGRLIARWLIGPPTDVVIVGYLGQVDLLLARALTRWPRRPVVLNALFSVYDTVVNDRRLLAPGSFLARLVRRLDRWSCRAADLVLLDTEAHIGYFSSEFGLPRDRFRRVFVGSDRAPAPPPRRAPGEPCRVLFVGTFIPLHGVDAIVAAAERLRAAEPRIDLRLIGRGQGFAAAAREIERLGLSRVELIGRWMGGSELADAFADADVCLGIFGATAKAQRVIPSKVFDALAAARPVVTADTPAARELLTHGVDAWLCPADDPGALAEALLALARDPALRARLAAGARRTFETRCSPEVIGREARAILEELVSPREPRFTGSAL